MTQEVKKYLIAIIIEVLAAIGIAFAGGQYSVKVGILPLFGEIDPLVIQHHTGIQWQIEGFNGVYSPQVVWPAFPSVIRHAVEIYSLHGSSELYAPEDPLSYENSDLSLPQDPAARPSLGRPLAGYRRHGEPERAATERRQRRRQWPDRQEAGDGLLRPASAHRRRRDLRQGPRAHRPQGRAHGEGDCAAGGGEGGQ